MWAFVLPAIYAAASWFMRVVVLKFVMFSILFFIVTEFLGFITSKLPGASSLTGAFGSIPEGIWYFLDLFQFSFGVSAVLSAYILRFSIRRIPFIG